MAAADPVPTDARERLAAAGFTQAEVLAEADVEVDQHVVEDGPDREHRDG